MELELRLRVARRAALRLIARYGIESPEHIQLEDIAWRQGIDIVVGRLDGAAARISRLNGRAKIRLSDRIGHRGHQRFSIAHELGHLILQHDTDITLCDNDDFYDFQGDSRAEAEANAFASELLLPDPLVRKLCEISPVSLDPVRRIADDFSTSLTASAIRFAQLSSECCAAVYSHNGVIKWIVKSVTFQYFVPKKRLDRRSLAYDYFAKGKVSEDCESMDASTWLEHDGRGCPEEIYEHSTPIPALNAVLSLLWLPEH